MIRFLPIVSLAILTACPVEGDVGVSYVGGCVPIEEAGACEAGPVCIDVAEILTSGVAYAWQCGGSGSPDDIGDADDCIPADVYALGDPSGDQICARCTDLDDTGPSEANPWPNLYLGVCEFGSAAERDEALSIW
jgi:hypothetical protein